MKKKDTAFDFQAALKALQDGQSLLGKEGILNPLIKNLTEAALEGKLVPILRKKLRRTVATAKAKKRSSLSMATLS